uniref:1-deoxy-D-xylulose-5-phosphate synthase n=1 Tax=Phocaeicola sp. TaxID=2773926 RepID=UPI003FEE23E5
FSTNRKYKGIRPFPSPEESEYDTFACGHASNSISAALGMAVSAKRLGETDRHIVAVIGDGSMSGGLAFEGLNNASSTPNDLLIILNDNDMSIDHSVGGMRQYLLNLNTNDKYNRLRYRLSQLFGDLGLLNERTRKSTIRFNNSLKSVLSKQQNIFEGMNIRYFGPVDGHNVTELVRTLNTLKDMKGPKLLHVRTVKGRGFAPAEEQATIWHAPGLFDPKTGKRLVQCTDGLPPLFQDVFGKTLVELAEQNPRIMGVTPAMPSGCSMNILMHAMPDRAFDVGIAEGHAVTFSGGMAKDGLLPFCNIYSSFMQRAYDNIIHDVALLRLNVVFCLDRSGLVGEDGPTHHGAFDLAYLRPIPNLTIAAPYDEHELRRMMYTAQLPDQGPFVIRYPRGRGRLTDWHCPLEAIEVGKGRRLKDGNDLAVLSIGAVGNAAADAIAEVEQAHPDISIAHYDLRFAKPLDEELLEEVARRFNRIVTVEDGILKGGVGSAVLEYMADHDHTPHVRRLGIPDRFIEHGAVDILRHLCGIDKEGIRDALLAELQR